MHRELMIAWAGVPNFVDGQHKIVTFLIDRSVSISIIEGFIA